MNVAGRLWAQHRLRIRLTLAAFLLSALVVTGAVGALIGALQHESQANVEALLKDRVAALAATVDTARGTVDITGPDDALLDTPNWVFGPDGRRIEGTPLGPVTGGVVDRLGAATSASETRSGPFRFRALPLRRHGRVVAVAVTGVDETPYTAATASTARKAVLLGALAVLGATALAALVLSRSLGPIAAMTDRAAEWSRRHSGHRFALGPPRDELSGLAAVLDDLLDRVDDALAAERRLTAEIAHELRTPLTVLAGEADLALMSRATAPSELARYRRISDAAGAMARAVTTLLDDAAAGVEAETEVAEALGTVVAMMNRPVLVLIDGPPQRVALRFGHLERVLAPLLDNATAAAVSTVRVTVRPEAESVVIVVTDDGPGIDDTVLDSLFEPGVTTKSSGTGLGLALARRLAQEAGGDLALLRARPAAFELRLPRHTGDAAAPERLRIAAASMLRQDAVKPVRKTVEP